MMGVALAMDVALIQNATSFSTDVLSISVLACFWFSREAYSIS
jgi:hypothetical protein